MSSFGDAFRRESDLVGHREVPIDARFGVHSLRASENFARPRVQRLSDVPELCHAFGMVKLAAIRANQDAGTVPPVIATAIEDAALELIADQQGLRRDLIVPLVQGGAGTSTNMNVNEVIANRALEILGYEPGEYGHCHPNDHVNRSQSTNDVYPTAVRVALSLRSARVEASARALESALRLKADEYPSTPKLARTQLQDAVGMTVGAEFNAWANTMAAATFGMAEKRSALLEVNLGGTAVGTGLTAPPLYRERVVSHLATITGMPIRPASDPISATTDPSTFLACSGALRGLAIALAKIANDLRLLSSGPHGGLGELHLPAVQGGSSMMPGKVNPVIPEFVNQLAFRTRGSDAAVAAALDAGQLQLNAMLPLVASELLDRQEDLQCAMDALQTRCIRGIVVDVGRNHEFVSHDLGPLSSMAAEEGYVVATREARRSGATDEEALIAAGTTIAHKQAPMPTHDNKEERCHD